MQAHALLQQLQVAARARAADLAQLAQVLATAAEQRQLPDVSDVRRGAMLTGVGAVLFFCLALVPRGRRALSETLDTFLATALMVLLIAALLSLPFGGCCAVCSLAHGANAHGLLDSPPDATTDGAGMARRPRATPYRPAPPAPEAVHPPLASGRRAAARHTQGASSLWLPPTSAFAARPAGTLYISYKGLLFLAASIAESYPAIAKLLPALPAPMA